MRVSGLHSGIVIFLLFFGASFLEDLQSMDWPRVATWVTTGILFFVLDSRRKSGIT